MNQQGDQQGGQGIRVMGEDTVPVTVESGKLKGRILQVRTVKRSERIKLMRAVGGNLDSDVAKMEFATLVMRLAVRDISPHLGNSGIPVDPVPSTDRSTGLYLWDERVADLLDDETLAKVVAAAMGQQVTEAQAGN